MLGYGTTFPKLSIPKILELRLSIPKILEIRLPIPKSLEFFFMGMIMFTVRFERPINSFFLRMRRSIIYMFGLRDHKTF